MKHDHRTQKREMPQRGMFRLFVKPKRLPATAVHDHDWDDDVPSVKLSTAFMVILFLHVAVVGGVMLFRFLERDSATAVAIAGEADAIPSAVPGAGPRLDDPALAGLARHRVKAHETLDQIAGQFGVTREDLTRTNRINADNPFRMGMTLVIPPREARAERPGLADAGARVEAARPVAEPGATRVEAARAVEPGTTVAVATQARPQAAAAPANAAARREHVVRPGETLWSISKRYDVPMNSLMKANSITNGNVLREGATLRIP
jgi:LysM repeat protein